MTLAERAKKLLADLESVCNDYAGDEQDHRLEARFLKSFEDVRRAALLEAVRICEQLNVNESKPTDRLIGYEDCMKAIRQRASEERSNDANTR